jgi:antitoxin MazE
MQSIGPNSTMSWNLLKILGSDTVVTCAVETAMRVSKRGNGLAVRLPKKLVEQMGLRAGDELDIVEVAERTLVVQKEDRRKAALARMASLNWTLPPDYKFDRDEANER